MNSTRNYTLITGASTGIGYELAKLFAKDRHNLILVARDEGKLETAKNELSKCNVEVKILSLDLSKSEDIQGLFNYVEMNKLNVDILVNNAGITKDGLILRMKENDFDSVIDVNLKGVFNTTKAASGIMMKQRYGKIINISSVVGLSGNAGQCNYAASKAGVIGFSKSIARELATRNVNVNVVAPGYINTDMTKDLPEKIKENIIQSIPMKKIGEPKEVANLVLFLASELSDYITGQVISVDGGMVMN